MGKIIDISHHQGDIDWEKVSKEVDLVVIRAQYGSKSIDKKYKEYVAVCKQYGIPFGLYAYARFVSVQDAIVEANDFLKRADKEAKFLVVDVEEVTTKNPDDLVPATQAYVDTLKRAGWKVGLYTGHSFYKQYGMDKVKADFLWIPRYGTNSGNPETKPDFPCDLWQYTEKGKVAGIDGYVDLNQLNGNKSLDWLIGKEVSKSIVKPKEQYGVVTASVLNVRAGHSTKYAVLGTLKKGERVKIGAKVGEWFNIYYGHHGGWVHSAYIKLD